MEWHEGLWVGIYKEVEMQKGENIELKCKEFCMYVWEMKSLEILNQMIQRIFIF